jgi:hypothetical protein
MDMKMWYQKRYVGVAALLATAMLGVGIASAFPINGTGGVGGTGFGIGGLMRQIMDPNSDLSAGQIRTMYEGSQAQDSAQQAIHQAVTDGNFAAWKTLMEQKIDQRAADQKSLLTQENFQKLVDAKTSAQQVSDLRSQIQAALEAGDYDKVVELRTQLLDLAGNMGGSKGMGGMDTGRMGHKGMGGWMGLGPTASSSSDSAAS